MSCHSQQPQTELLVVPRAIPAAWRRHREVTALGSSESLLERSGRAVTLNVNLKIKCCGPLTQQPLRPAVLRDVGYW